MRSTYRYRVNYGNGQVRDLDSRRECWRHIASLPEYSECCWVEFQDPDTREWFATGLNDKGRQ